MSYTKLREQYARDCALAGITPADADTLRRSAMTLHRWYEAECGNSNDYNSWAIERDETTGVPYMVTHPHQSGAKSRRTRIADRETPALNRAKEIAARLGAELEVNGDPRGWPLRLKTKDGRTIAPPCP